MIFHLSEAVTGGILLQKVFLEVSQNSQENTCGKVSFLINLQAEAIASDLSLVYFISTEKWNEEREIPCWSSNIYFFSRVSVCFTSKISKEIWQVVIWSENVFKGNLMLQVFMVRGKGRGKVSGWWTLDELQYENDLKDQL